MEGREDALRMISYIIIFIINFWIIILIFPLFIKLSGQITMITGKRIIR
jgi:hypothetical protein